VANIVRSGSLDSDPMNRDLKNMLWKVHQTLGYTAPSDIQYDFCDLIQGPSPETGARRILMGFRGVSKSHVSTVASIWKLRRDRTKRVLVTSATGRFASLISSFAWQMVSEFDWLADMKPSSTQRRSAIAFDVGGAPVATQHESFASVPITGQITGRRATDIIGDDLETPNTSDTETARADLIKRSSELVGAIILPGGDIDLLGTAQTEDTFYLKMEERGFSIRIYPILFPHLPTGIPEVDKERVTTKRYGPRLAPSILAKLEANPALAGTSTNPERFSEVDIAARRRAWGLTEFERQFLMLLDAGKGRGNPLKLRDIPVMELKRSTDGHPFKVPAEVDFQALPIHTVAGIDVDAMTGDSILYGPSRTEIYLEPEEVVCYVDPSGDGKDETTWTIGAGLQGRIFVVHQGYSTEGHDVKVLKSIAADCKLWGVQTVEVESNFGQGMFGELLHPQLQAIDHAAAIVDIRQGKVSKEKRIVETLEPLITDHRLILSADLLRRDFPVDYEHLEEDERRYHRLTYQLTRMTKNKGAVKHDDRVDGLSGLARHFVGTLLRSLAQKNEEARLKGIDAEIEKMIDERRRQGLPLHGLEAGRPALGRPSKRTR
jgi:hypothetical protein